MNQLPGHAAEGTILLVTREIRWFHRGDPPAALFEWFYSIPGGHELELRTDFYDVSAARVGSGVKYRAGQFMDSKFRIAVREDPSLPPSLEGEVEDWIKVSSPIAPDGPPPPIGFFRVDKQLVTKEFFARDLGMELSDPDAGCEMEIASLVTPAGRAWSLCFESFGSPDVRRDAFRAGFACIAEHPIPNGVLFEDHNSSGYPSWIAGLAVNA